MPYRLTISEKDAFGKGKFKNAKGNTECVEFVRQAAGAPPTIAWKRGALIMGSAPGTISRGTVIATFDDKGRYPTDGQGKHAAIYLSHDLTGIRVLDQWNKQGEVLERIIYFNKPSIPRSNAGKTFYVVE